MNTEQKQITEYSILELKGIIFDSMQSIELHQNNLKVIKEEMKRREDLANQPKESQEIKKRGRPFKK